MAEWKERCEERVRDRSPYASGHRQCGELAVFASYPPRCAYHGGIRNHRLFNFLRSQGVYMPISAGQLVELLHKNGYTQIVDAPKVYGEKKLDGLNLYLVFERGHTRDTLSLRAQQMGDDAVSLYIHRYVRLTEMTAEIVLKHEKAILAAMRELE